jgi:hypothetical protein
MSTTWMYHASPYNGYFHIARQPELLIMGNRDVMAIYPEVIDAGTITAMTISKLMPGDVAGTTLWSGGSVNHN